MIIPLFVKPLSHQRKYKLAREFSSRDEFISVSGLFLVAVYTISSHFAILSAVFSMSSPSRKGIGVMNTLLVANRPFYSCVPSDLAFEWKRGWR